jgi:hypothetical protein
MIQIIFNGHPPNSKDWLYASSKKVNISQVTLNRHKNHIRFFELHDRGGITVSTEGGNVNVFSETGVEVPFCTAATLVLGGKIPFAFCKFLKNLVPPP